MPGRPDIKASRSCPPTPQHTRTPAAFFPSVRSTCRRRELSGRTSALTDLIRSEYIATGSTLSRRWKPAETSRNRNTDATADDCPPLALAAGRAAKQRSRREYTSCPPLCVREMKSRREGTACQFFFFNL